MIGADVPVNDRNAQRVYGIVLGFSLLTITGYVSLTVR